MFTRSKNSYFQYVYFIAGNCHTADEAYRIINDQLEGREQAVKNANATIKRIKAKRLRAEATLKLSGINPWVKLKAEAELIEVQATSDLQQACYDEALRERDFLKDLLTKLDPLRKYRHLPDHEAMQACQREEWMYELMFRAENFLLSNGTIPADHVEAMRQHPDFEGVIAPHVRSVQLAMKQGTAHAGVQPPQFVKELEKALPTELQISGYGVNPLALRS